MSEFVTLNRSAPEFNSYLLGTFSEEQRALPMKSLNVNSANETITFRIVNKKDIIRPRFDIYIAKLLKLNKFVYLLFPIFLILVKNLDENKAIDPLAGALGTLGLIFIFLSSSFRNDYTDHLVGIDRVEGSHGTRPIQRGWITAQRSNQLALYFLVLGLLCALPVVIAFPKTMIVIVLATLVAVWTQYLKSNSYKFQIGGELSLYLLFGPLLTAGYQLSLGSPIDKECLFIGGIWGWLVLFMHNLNILVDLMAYSQGGFKNTMTWLGFDKGRDFLNICWGIYLFLYFIYNYNYGGKFWGWYSTAALILISPKLLFKIKNTQSPVGSDMLDLYKMGRIFFVLAVFIWGLENFWYLIK